MAPTRDSCYNLIPSGPGADQLAPLSFKTGADILILLGRKEIFRANATSNEKSYISRRHCEIHVRNKRIHIKPLCQLPTKVCRNAIACPQGKLTELVDGDVIYLLGPTSKCQYTLQIDRDGGGAEKSPLASSAKSNSRSIGGATRSPAVNPTNLGLVDLSHPHNSQDIATKATSSAVASSSSSSEAMPAESTVQSVPETAAPNLNTLAPSNSTTATAGPTVETRAIEEHLECMICLEAIAFAHNLPACGDTYCYECLHDWAKKSTCCPSCNAGFTLDSAMFNRTLDNVIYEIVKTHGEEALGAWNARKERGKAMKEGKGATGAVASQKPAKPTASSSGTATTRRQPQVPTPLPASFYPGYPGYTSNAPAATSSSLRAARVQHFSPVPSQAARNDWERKRTMIEISSPVTRTRNTNIATYFNSPAGAGSRRNPNPSNPTGTDTAENRRKRRKADNQNKASALIDLT